MEILEAILRISNSLENNCRFVKQYDIIKYKKIKMLNLKEFNITYGKISLKLVYESKVDAVLKFHIKQ